MIPLLINVRCAIITLYPITTRLFPLRLVEIITSLPIIVLLPIVTCSKGYIRTPGETALVVVDPPVVEVCHVKQFIEVVQHVRNT